MKDDIGGLFVGLLVALPVSLALWALLYVVMLWVYTWPLEVVVKVAAGVFLMVGSWLVLRACAELDR